MTSARFVSTKAKNHEINNENDAEATQKKNAKRSAGKQFMFITAIGVILTVVVFCFSTVNAFIDRTDTFQYVFSDIEGYLIDPSGRPVVAPEGGTMPKYLSAFNSLSAEQKEEVREALRNGDYVIIPNN